MTNASPPVAGVRREVPLTLPSFPLSRSPSTPSPFPPPAPPALSSRSPLATAALPVPRASLSRPFTAPSLSQAPVSPQRPPSALLSSSPTPDGGPLTARSILLTRTARRAYKAAPHGIPTFPPPSLLPLGPSPAPFHAAVASPRPIPGPNFFLSSDSNRSDAFLASMKAMSNNFSSLDDSSPTSSPRRLKGPVIARQLAFTAENHRRELALAAELKEATMAVRPSTASLLPVQSTLSKKGGYLPHAVDNRSPTPQPWGEERATAYQPSYWSGALFVPVCVRGPALPFGEGREKFDEVKEMKRKIAAREKKKAADLRRRGAQREEAKEADDADVTPNFVRANITALKASSTAVTSRAQLSLSLQQRQQHAREVRQRMQQEADERNGRLMHRYTAEYRQQRAQEEEEVERREVLQRSWLLVVAVSTRMVCLMTQVEHYQGVMRLERATKAIISWLRRVQARRRKRRFLHARRQLRLFFEERAMLAVLRDDEERKRHQLDIVLSFLQATLSRRQHAVVTAFGGLERKAVVIQRAWRGFLVTSKWRLWVQTLQFIAFDQHPETCDPAQPAGDTTHRPSTPQSRPMSAGPARPRSHIPKARTRYLRFQSPLLLTNRPRPSIPGPALEVGAAKWNGMVRMQREVMGERLLEEARLHRQVGQRRWMEAIRDHINTGADGIVSPRAALMSPRTRLPGPSVCRVEWPGDAGPSRLRRVLLTTRQLHELHRRALKVCTAMGVTGGEHQPLERLAVVGVGGKYVRRAVLPAEGDLGEVEGDGQWKIDRLSGGPWTVSWAQMKRMSCHPIMLEVDAAEEERRDLEAQIKQNRERANSIVATGETQGGSPLLTLLQFQAQLAASQPQQGASSGRGSVVGDSS